MNHSGLMTVALVRAHPYTVAGFGGRVSRRGMTPRNRANSMRALVGGGSTPGRWTAVVGSDRDTVRPMIGLLVVLSGALGLVSAAGDDRCRREANKALCSKTWSDLHRRRPDFPSCDDGYSAN